MNIKNKLVNAIKDQGQFLLFLFIVVIVRSSLADQYLIPSGSMEPTLQVGDHIYVDKMAYSLQIPLTDISLAKTGEPQRGDIVVFINPKNEIRMVKRLIAVPGDEVQVIDGYVKVNGKPLQMATSVNSSGYYEKNGDKEYFVKRHPFNTLRGYYRETVPEGHYFMLGDNRDNSSDSRAWGFVPRDNLLGKANNVLFSTQFLSLKPKILWERWGKNLYE